MSLHRKLTARAKMGKGGIETRVHAQDGLSDMTSTNSTLNQAICLPGESVRLHGDAYHDLGIIYVLWMPIRIVGGCQSDGHLPLRYTAQDG